jgi:RNA polymerase sigma factor (sigma-70 family)
MKPRMEFDQTALDSLRRNDPAVWREFLAAFDPLIRAIAGWPKWHFDLHRREDIEQTVRAELARCIGQVHTAASLAAFVKRVAVRRCIDEVRRQARERGLLVPLTVVTDDGETLDLPLPTDERLDPARLVIAAEQAAALRRALDEVGEPCQTTIREFYGEGRSYREMAALHGVSVNTIGSRLARCLDRLRTILERPPGPAREAEPLRGTPPAQGGSA